MDNPRQQAVPELPHDMLVEIASRSSTDTLASLRAAAKSLNLATYEPTFVQLHSVSGFLIQGLLRNEYVKTYVPTDVSVSQCQSVSLDFLPLTVKMNACSDELGLFYCESKDVQSRFNGMSVKNHYVCKATTREWTQIPNPVTKSGPMAASGMVAMNSNPLRFKIVRLTKPKLNMQTRFDFNRYVCQVFESEKPHRGKWRKLKKEIQLGKEGEGINPDSPMVTVNGNLHVLVGPTRILAFDSMSDEWDFFSTPETSQVENNTLVLNLLKHRGKLSFMAENRTSKTLTLWVMEDYKNKVWTRSCQLCTQAPRSIYNSASLDRLCNSDKGLFIEYSAIFFYNFRDGSYKKQALDMHPMSIFGFRSDFKKLGWKTAADSKGYIERQDAKQIARQRGDFE